jgi:hypothetical protein
MTNRRLGSAFIVLAIMLCVPAIGAIFGAPTFSESCRRYCWVFELAKSLLGESGANRAGAIVWFALALLSIYTGLRLRKSSESK